ncbi:hypothetical protein FISHEDRAFT_78752 [Fistulina hepatica ATCC 64428]|uniref:SAC3/GANP/THP3 conserved domain-containing protein n=1 Tax=Fistulina hepatica ATCC 64428 TaxID=1128425 RepID=A0A0D7A1F1_9AGAR|nr:hypothetical protein FISHEDRAFT_78752 [Fistulina hepatica ATCC 64428]
MALNVRGRGRGGAATRNKRWLNPEDGTRSHDGGKHVHEGGRTIAKPNVRRGGSRHADGNGGSASDSEQSTPTSVPASSTAFAGGLPPVGAQVPGFKTPIVNLWQGPEPDLTSEEDRERYYKAMMQAREQERLEAIALNLMDDGSARPLSESITRVGTCPDMCPRMERYRRQREHQINSWEVAAAPVTLTASGARERWGFKHIDHVRAVKAYERAIGDRTLPSDLRPLPVLMRTLDYLFHDLLPRGGFHDTQAFIRDRTRACRTDMKLQNMTGAAYCDMVNRCARYHLLALHVERRSESENFSVALEDQLMSNCFQDLKENRIEHRTRVDPQWVDPTEVEMRLYHVLVHTRDTEERSDIVPPHIASHTLFQLAHHFRKHVQRISAPIHKSSKLKADAEAMQIFNGILTELRKDEETNRVTIYLVACILEHLFGSECLDEGDVEAIRDGLPYEDIIDNVPWFRAHADEARQAGFRIPAKALEDNPDGSATEQQQLPTIIVSNGPQEQLPPTDVAGSFLSRIGPKVPDEEETGVEGEGDFEEGDGCTEDGQEYDIGDGGEEADGEEGDGEFIEDNASDGSEREVDREDQQDQLADDYTGEEPKAQSQSTSVAPQTTVFGLPSGLFGSSGSGTNAFGGASSVFGSKTNAFGGTSSVFGSAFQSKTSAFGHAQPTSVFNKLSTSNSAPSSSTLGASSTFGAPSGVFGSASSISTPTAVAEVNTAPSSEPVANQTLAGESAVTAQESLVVFEPTKQASLPPTSATSPSIFTSVGSSSVSNTSSPSLLCFASATVPPPTDVQGAPKPPFSNSSLSPAPAPASSTFTSYTVTTPTGGFTSGKSDGAASSFFAASTTPLASATSANPLFGGRPPSQIFGTSHWSTPVPTLPTTSTALSAEGEPSGGNPLFGGKSPAQIFGSNVVSSFPFKPSAPSTSSTPVETSRSVAASVSSQTIVKPTSSTLNPRAAPFALPSSVSTPHVNAPRIPSPLRVSTSVANMKTSSAAEEPNQASLVKLPEAPRLKSIDLPPMTPTTAGPSTPGSLNTSFSFPPTSTPKSNLLFDGTMSGAPSPSANMSTFPSFDASTSLSSFKRTSPVARNPQLSRLQTTFTNTSPSRADPGTPGLLSPLVVSSPSASFPNAPFTSRETASDAKPSVASTASISKSLIKSVAVDPTNVEVSSEDMLEKAQTMARRGRLVKECFERWLGRTKERIAYWDAREAGDKYSAKIRSSRSVSAISSRRSSSSPKPTPSILPRKRLASRRKSRPSLPLVTDDELAKRFKANHEEHHRRWAPGTFLQSVRRRVSHLLPRRPETQNRLLMSASPTLANGSPSVLEDASTDIPFSARPEVIGALYDGMDRWSIWFSMNLDNDGTAIWVERKFDVPAAGRWASPTVFEIPFNAQRTSEPGHPGLIVFECTPIPAGTDELEKKYVVLDDCARLRDVIQALPPRRYYNPSLFIISWTDNKRTPIEKDMSEMAIDGQIQAYVDGSELESYTVFAITDATLDVDTKFSEALKSLVLDVKGRMAQIVSLRGLYKMFDQLIESFVADWLRRSANGQEHDWLLYAHLIRSLCVLLAQAGRMMHSILNAHGQPPAEFPPVKETILSSSSDDVSPYTWASTWLSAFSSPRRTQRIRDELFTNQRLGRDFPVRIFIDHIRELAFDQIIESAGLDAESNKRVHVLAADLIAAKKEFFDIVETNATEMERQAQKAELLRKTEMHSVSPKRPNSAEVDGVSSKRRRTKGFIASQSYVNASTLSSNGSSALKNGSASYAYGISELASHHVGSRLALPPAGHSSLEGSDASMFVEPRTSPTKDAASKPVVTTAMLKALTKNMREKYAG